MSATTTLIPDLARRARAAAPVMARASTDLKDAALPAAADRLEADGMATGFLDRLQQS